MKLSLKRIGKIESAEVALDGITVIAGENNTGKSTVSRALFSVFHTLFCAEAQIREERVRSVENQIDLMLKCTGTAVIPIGSNEEAREIIQEIEIYQDKGKALRDQMLRERLNSYMHCLSGDRSQVDSAVDESFLRIQEILSVSDEELEKSVLEKHLRAEFNGQINNIFTDEGGEICVWEGDKKLTISVLNDRVTNIQKSDNMGFHIGATYIDDPLILDESRYWNYQPIEVYNHRTDLRDKLFSYKRSPNLVEEIVASRKLDQIYEKLSAVCSGEVVREKGVGYKRAESDKILDVKNLSTGLKTFIIIRILLEREAIQYGGMMILDEPEIHLHPEWQLLFAEIIVLLQKEFRLRVVINTHSPYFLNAVEVYAAKHGVADVCHYYLASMRGQTSVIEDVTGDTERIYAKLARPLQDLENERFTDD